MNSVVIDGRHGTFADDGQTKNRTERHHIPLSSFVLFPSRRSFLMHRFTVRAWPSRSRVLSALLMFFPLFTVARSPAVFCFTDAKQFLSFETLQKWNTFGHAEHEPDRNE
jgi:hypothetical protein